MTTIRLLGMILGSVFFVILFLQFRARRLWRVDFFWGTLFSLGLITVSLWPETVSALRDMLLLRATEFSRLIALLVVSTLLIWLLLISQRAKHAKLSHQFDILVRRLTLQEFKNFYVDLRQFSPIVVIIPAYNEAQNIGRVIQAIPSAIESLQTAVLVIDDGSQDDTLAQARAVGGFAIRPPFNRGGGAALRCGYDIAQEMGAKIVVTMDADGQHDPTEMAGLIRPILEDRYDFMIGSRLLGTREKDSWVRLAGIYFFNFIIRLLTGVKITDCSNGFRAFRIRDLARILLLQDQYHTSELIIDAAKKGVRLGEAPVTVRVRAQGHSKKGGNVMYGLQFARAILKTWWR
ncbi:MAG: glycosyltransferase family 2 protein [Magnetococcus sp. DMHC-6]